MEQYFDDTNPQIRGKVPVVKAPEKPTKEEWLQHQATHTPFAPWRKHCLVARMIRHKHPSRGRRAVMVQDAECLEGKLAKISIGGEVLPGTGPGLPAVGRALPEGPVDLADRGRR